MKINFVKRELVSLNLLDLEGAQLAKHLGCKILSILLIYLGMSLH
jgi:hypothetical protein